MRAALAALVASLVFVASGSTEPVERLVTIPGKFYAPGKITALVGDEVTWRNDDSSTHTVTADDRSFDSGDVAPGTTFTRTFATPGVYAYHCSIHRFMHGEIDVVAIVLKAPAYAVPVGVETALKGLAPADARSVTIRRVGAGDATDVGAAPVAPDGSFRFPLVATSSATYVASAGGLTSKAARVVVAARLELRAVRAARGALVRIMTAPAQPHARLQLQAYLYERFDFVPIRRARLDGRGRAILRLRHVRAPLHLRAFLPRGVNGFGRAFSRTIVLRPARGS